MVCEIQTSRLVHGHLVNNVEWLNMSRPEGKIGYPVGDALTILVARTHIDE